MVRRLKTRNFVYWKSILAADSQWGLVLALRKAPLNTCCCMGCMWRSDSELAYGPCTGLKTLEFSPPSTLHGCCCLGPENRIDVVAEMFLFTSAIMRETEPPRERQIPKSPLQQMIISMGWHVWRHICKCPECGNVVFYLTFTLQLLINLLLYGSKVS